MVLGMLFLTFSNADIQFAEKELTWKTYTTEKALPTTCQVKIIYWKEFAKVTLDENVEDFVMHVSSLRSRMTIHPAREAQLALLLAKQVTVPTKYSDFADVFLEKSANVLLELTGANEHLIKLEKGKQTPYGLIHNLGPVELETLKTYIKTNLANGFIWTSKSPAGALILFVRKPNGSACLCVDYQWLNNLTIENWYPLSLISESLDWLGRAKQFTQLDLTSTYHRMRIKEGDKWKTAFQTWYGHFEYHEMPFWLFNAPASFQGYINKILAKKLNIFVIVYLDDILIYIEDPGQAHVNAVRWVLKELRKNSLFANLKKCHFYKDEVRFLGYVVSAHRVKMKEERIDAVRIGLNQNPYLIFRFFSILPIFIVVSFKALVR